MEQGKHGNSDADNEKPSDESAGVGRSYECTFCKRGFTNAQALGGHMNIHRKDKAKAKQKNKEEASNKPSPISRYAAPHLSPADHYPQINYQVYLPSPNPNFQTGINNYLPLWRPDRFDSNLSLRIGASPPLGDVDSNVKDDDVDLELRLGHDP